MVLPLYFTGLTWSSATGAHLMQGTNCIELTSCSYLLTSGGPGKDISPTQSEKSQRQRDVPQGNYQNIINRKEMNRKQTEVIGFFAQNKSNIQCP